MAAAITNTVLACPMPAVAVKSVATSLPRVRR